MDLIKYKQYFHRSKGFYKAIINYLKKQNIYDIYIEEVKKQRPEFVLQQYVLKKGGYDLINMTLTWSFTAQGQDFWSRQSSAYMKWWYDTAPHYKKDLPRHYRDLL